MTLPERGSVWQLNALDARAVEVWTVQETEQWRIFGSEAVEEGIAPGVVMSREYDGCRELSIWPATIFEDTGMVTRVG